MERRYLGELRKPMTADPAKPIPYPFLRGDGDMAARIAAHDWSATPLGALDTWPASLRNAVALMLRSEIAITLLWGEQGIMIYNDAYGRFAGGRHPGLLGVPVREAWAEIAAFNDNVVRTCLAGGTLSYRDQQLVLARHDGQPEALWFNLDYSPVPGDDGEPAGVFVTVFEDTAGHNAREALQRNEARLSFLDQLGRAASAERDPQQALATIARITGEYLAVSICAYADMDADADGFTIRGDWHAEGSPTIVGHYSLAGFGALAVRELSAGRPLIVNDVAELAPHEAKTFRDIGIAATICMPLVKNGRLTALMAIHHADPHRWTDEELTVIREVTERSWAHIERVRAAHDIAERDRRHRQVLDGASDYVIIATDLDGRITLWNAGATRILGWDEAEMLGQTLDRIFPAHDLAENMPARLRAEALANGVSEGERWRVRASGQHFWAHGELTPLRDDAGQPVGFVKVLRDRTAEYHAYEALRESHALLGRAQEAGGVGLFTVELDTNQLRPTPEFCRIFGVEPCDIMDAARLEHLVVPEDRGIVSNYEGRRTGRARLDVEYRIHRANDGDERVVARRADYEVDADGRPVRMIGVVQDITDRRRMQLALELSQASFSALAQFMPNQVWRAGSDGMLDWFNDQVYAFSGAARGTLEREGWHELVHPDDLPAALERWRHSVASGDTYETEYRLRAADDTYRWHLARAVPLRGPEGDIASWVGTNTDIHAQKLAEEASAKDRDRLWGISQDLLLVCDFDGLITAVNPTATRLLGWAEEEMVGGQIADFVHPDDLGPTADEVGKLSHGQTTLAFENRYRAKNGEYRLFDWTAVPEAGRIHAVGRDITDQRATEEALRQSQKMEAVGQLTGGIAHDFNNLLQGITGSLDLIKARVAQGRANEIDRFLTGATSSANRAAALTHRLLAFSRRQPLDPRPVRANPLIASMEDLLRRTLGEKIRMEMVLAGGLWLTRCDPNQLESAILNLVINARDAMPDGGQLTIETCNAHLDSLYAARQREVRPGQYVCICVTDTGTGMTKETIARAFEPFFTTKPIGHGTGLGLSMIYGFARQSEGYARIYSEVGQGTTVKLYLPRFHGDAQVEEPVQSRELPGSEKGEVVLVVEDEAVVRGLIVEVLGELGYRAIEAPDGPKGLEILQSDRRIDLLVTDIGLPGLNGRQVADAARVLRPELKVLFMTGYAENAALASGFLEPGMAMITKPFAMDVLATRIREIVEA